MEFLTTEPGLGLLTMAIAWLLTQAVKRWRPGLDRKRIPVIAGGLAMALSVLLVGAAEAVSNVELSFWMTLRLGTSAGMAAILAHYSGRKLTGGVSYVIEWLHSAQGQK